MQGPLSLVVLAAGIGSRYGGLKQIDPIGPNGEIIIEYSVHDALRAGFERVVFVIRRDIEADFRQVIASRFEGLLPIDLVFQDMTDLPVGHTVPAARKKPWGTGHAVRAARHVVNGPFCVINADDFYGGNAYARLAEWVQAHRGATASAAAAPTPFAMVAFALRNTLSEHGYVSRGVCDVDAAGRMRSVVERVRIEKEGDGAKFVDENGAWQHLTGDEPVSLNFWGFTPALFPLLEREFERFMAASGTSEKAEFFIPTVVDTLIRSGEATVDVLRTPDLWIGVTYPDDKPLVVAAIRALVDDGRYPASLKGNA